MNNIDNLFFELIQVSIGNRVCLSHTPKFAEWGELYTMAKKQSLVGICFAGVQKLQAQRQAPNSWGDERGELLYLQWIGIAAKIQQRNQAVDEQCVALQKRISADGLKSAILKGQGVAQLYAEHLRGLRQSGDIDVYVQGGMKKMLAWCREKYGKVEFDYINAHVPCYKDTEVELHWRAQSLTNLFANKRLQKWLEREDVKAMMVGGKAKFADGNEIVVPTAEFNAFYILLHCYHHMFESGLGLRQLMDYYFVLVAYAEHKLPQMNRELDVNALLREFGLMRFAKGMMWIMGHVFGLEREYMLCEPDEQEGRFLLDEVMQNGNFGHYDRRNHSIKNKWIAPFATRLQHNWHLATHFPSEFFWAPVWLMYHFFWKRINIKN